MAAFDLPDDNREGRPDLDLLRWCPVTKIHSRRVLDDTTGWLAEHGYELRRLDAITWRSEDDVYDSFWAVFDLHYLPQRNRHTFDEALWDIATGDWNWEPQTAAGLVFVLDHYDAFVRAEPDFAHRFVDAIASWSREALLFGLRIICLLQSDDPDLRLPAVAASEVHWHGAEFLDAVRRGGK